MNKIKKILKVITFFSFISISISCGGQEKLKTDLLLEVTVKTLGQVTFQGEILLLRLSHNGEAQADILSMQTKKETRFERESFSLAESDLREIKKSLQMLEKTEFEKNYLPNAPASDLHSTTTIIFNSAENRKIEIVMEENHTGILIDTYREKYPEPIIDLLSKVHRLRQEFK